MSYMNQEKIKDITHREYWVDYVKVFACLLVLLGHFVQSMVKVGIIPENNLFEWFNGTIYFFHVNLFFICSGYLYQKNECRRTFRDRIDSIYKKALNLGIPYLVFSTITYLLKYLFSNDVNEQVSNYFHVIFNAPLSPYWYLYALFFIFLVSHVFTGKKDMIFSVVIAVLLYYITAIPMLNVPYCVYITFLWIIWFVLGQAIFVLKEFVGNRMRFNRVLGIILGSFFLILSFFFYNTESKTIVLVLGLVACISITFLIMDCPKSKVLSFFSKYTFQIYLMHTIFASCMRIILLKLDIGNVFVHFVLGLFASIFGPIIISVILGRTFAFNAILYPVKTISKSA